MKMAPVQVVPMAGRPSAHKGLGLVSRGGRGSGWGRFHSITRKGGRHSPLSSGSGYERVSSFPISISVSTSASLTTTAC